MRCEGEDIFNLIVKTVLGTLNYLEKTIDYDNNFVWDIEIFNSYPTKYIDDFQKVILTEVGKKIY